MELFETVDPREVGLEAARQAVTMAGAGYCPAGVMPVAIGNGFGGVIFHEACGHSLEASSVAYGNSQFCGKLGQKIAHEKVTAIDDGTIPGDWGSINIDDEGTPAQRKVLIENGVLKSYMIDKFNGRRMGMASTGSARRLVGAVLGATMVKNEITAHAVGTTTFYPDVRTILEIGGQDSKIILVENGVAVDYAMNTLCAAGTGAFLSSQAKRLGIDRKTLYNKLASLDIE